MLLMLLPVVVETYLQQLAAGVDVGLYVRCLSEVYRFVLAEVTKDEDADEQRQRHDRQIY